MVETEKLEKWAVEEKSSLEWLWLSSVSAEAGELEKAQTSLVKAKEMHAEGILYHLVQGQIFLANNQLEEAAEEYRNALQMDSRCVGALKKLFEIALLNQDIEGSQDVFKRIAKIDPWFKPSAVEEKAEPVAAVAAPVAAATPDLESLALDREDEVEEVSEVVAESETIEVDLSNGDFELPDFDGEDDFDFDNLVADTLGEPDAIEDDADSSDELSLDDSIDASIDEAVAETLEEPVENVFEESPVFEEDNSSEAEGELLVNEEDVSSALDDIFGEAVNENETVELNVNEVAGILDEAATESSESFNAPEAFEIEEPISENISETGIPMTGEDVSATIDALFEEDSFFAEEEPESAVAEEVQPVALEESSEDLLEEVNIEDELFDIAEVATEETLTAETSELDVVSLDVEEEISELGSADDELSVDEAIDVDLENELGEDGESSFDAESSISGLSGVELEEDIFASKSDYLESEAISSLSDSIEDPFEESPLGNLSLDEEASEEEVNLAPIEESALEEVAFEETAESAIEDLLDESPEESPLAGLELDESPEDTITEASEETAEITEVQDELATEEIEEASSSIEEEQLQSDDPLASSILDTMDDLFGDETDETPLTSSSSEEEFFNIEETTGDDISNLSTGMDDLNLDELLDESESGDVGVSTPTIAEIYVQQGLFGKAIATYEELLSLSPNNEELQNRLDEIRELQSQSDDDSDEGDLDNPPRKKIRT